MEKLKTDLKDEQVREQIVQQLQNNKEYIFKLE